MSERYLKVSEVNNYIKKLFQNDMILSNISIEGEISNFNHHYSGHMYFNLKDEGGRIKCVMFKRDNEKLLFNPSEGMKLIATGYISVYEKGGEYQLYVRHLKEKGLGDLYREFEELKKQLEEEGLFKSSKKKEIPPMPRKIGVVTAATGAAVRDIVSVIGRRYPICDIVVYPSLVQGPDAPQEIIRALEYLDAREDIDLVIVGRGGGSIEDLFAFNSEALARTIYGMKTPLISAVGHETDFTIADFVADMRAPTPSAAAELAVPDMESLIRNTEGEYERLLASIVRHLDRHKNNLNYMKKSIDHANPLNRLRKSREDLEGLNREMSYLIRESLGRKRNNLIQIKSSLDFLNPKLAMERGYGLITDKNNRLVHSVKDLNIKDNLYINLRDGRIRALVEEIEEE